MLLNVYKDREAMNYRVFIDDQEAKGCYLADEEQGVALCYEFDADGRLIRDPDSGFEPKIIRRVGRVRLERIG